MTTARDAVLGLFRVSDNRAASFDPLPAILPGHRAPVIRKAADGERELSLLGFGFVLPQQDRAPRRVSNVRDDKVRSNPFWRDTFEQRRCLVPASSFSELEGEGPTVWHWFALKGSEPRPLFAFAGLWRHWKGPLKKDGPNVDLDVFGFMTTLPNALVSTINQERMPVLLTDEREFETWLSATSDEAYTLVQQYPPEQMRIVQSGSEREDLLAA